MEEQQIPLMNRKKNSITVQTVVVLYLNGSTNLLVMTRPNTLQSFPVQPSVRPVPSDYTEQETVRETRTKQRSNQAKLNKRF